MISNPIDRIFILDFDREEFYHVEADTVEFNHAYHHPAFSGMRESPEDANTLIIDDVMYRPGETPQVVLLGKDIRQVVVFVYGEPTPLQIEYQMKLLTSGRGE